MQDVKNAQGTVANRERALRLVTRVAKDIDKLDRLPSDQEIIELCTQHTTRECKCSILL